MEIYNLFDSIYQIIIKNIPIKVVESVVSMINDIKLYKTDDASSKMLN